MSTQITTTQPTVINLTMESVSTLIRFMINSIIMPFAISITTMAVMALVVYQYQDQVLPDEMVRLLTPASERAKIAELKKQNADLKSQKATLQTRVDSALVPEASLGEVYESRVVPAATRLYSSAQEKSTQVSNEIDKLGVKIIAQWDTFSL